MSARIRQFSSINIDQSYGPKADDHIYVAMSSGVDSSVAAAIMAEKHKNVIGIFMHNWHPDARCAENDWNDVQKVCQEIGIPCKRLNFEKEYWINVFEPMINSYDFGDTPNPDVSCNRYVKFGVLYQAIEQMNRSTQAPWWLVTGHYCRLTGDEKSPVLLRPVDHSKDQSYYLSTVRSFQRVYFPLGKYLKKDIRELAKNKYQLSTAEKPDSQGLCFVSQSERRFSNFLGEYLQSKPGNIVTPDGKVVGQHNGIWNATIGQKSGISMPQGNPEYRGVWYVSKKDYQKNEITIVKGRDNFLLFNDQITTEPDFHWINGDILQLSDSNNLYARYRSLGDLIKIERMSIGGDGSVTVQMESPQRALAKGQYLVIYENDRVLGGGMIKTAIMSKSNGGLSTSSNISVENPSIMEHLG